jgi:hypothetical protein
MQIHIDFTDLIRWMTDLPSNAEPFAEAVVREVAGQLREETATLAEQQLSTRTAPKYIEDLELEAEGTEARVFLKAGLGSAIEEGAPPFIMPANDKVVPFFFWPRSQWRRRKKHGGHIVAPKALPQLLGLRRTTGQSAPGGRAGFQVQQYGQQLPAGIVAPTFKARVPDRPSLQNRTDLPAGMYLLKDPENIAEPGPLGMAFRTHSEDWHHPGIEKRGFFGIAIRHVKERIDDIVDGIAQEWIF